MLNTNDVLQGRYRIQRQLGQGGMGAVYEAIDERFGEPIALKEILVELTNHAEPDQLKIVRKAFAREAKSLAKAKHESVPYVRDYFTERNCQYLVMELVEGDDLASLLSRKNRPFPLENVLNWIDQLLDALDYLHNLRPPIIHRDIKPQNLKLTSRGRVKLLDFGIAKSVDAGAFTITNQTFVGATLNYSPIEQILRVINSTFLEFILLKHKERAEKFLEQNTDNRSDIYALGATFYHVATNHPPTDVVKRTLDIWEGKGDPLPKPSEINQQIPPAISNCLLRALEIDRDQRFANAAEMRAFLAEAASSKPQFILDPLQITDDGEDRGLNTGKNTQFRRATQAETERILDWELKDTIADNAASGVSVLTIAASVPESINESKNDGTNEAVDGYVENSEGSFQFAGTEPNATVPIIEMPSEPLPGYPNFASVKKIESAEEDQEVVFATQDSAPVLSYGSGISTPARFGSTLFFALPISVLGVLGIAIAGTYFLIGTTTPSESLKPTGNITIERPGTVGTTSAAANSSSNAASDIDQSAVKQDDSVFDFPASTQPASKPVKAATPRRPTPTPKKQGLSDDCIYNGRC